MEDEVIGGLMKENVCLYVGVSTECFLQGRNLFRAVQQTLNSCIVPSRTLRRTVVFQLLPVLRNEGGWTALACLVCTCGALRCAACGSQQVRWTLGLGGGLAVRRLCCGRSRRTP